jgi:membrane protease YdiL (CAAX protease family)
MLGGLTSFLLAFAILGIVPLLLTRWIFDRAPREFGLTLGSVREGLAWLAVGVPIAVVLGWLSADQPGLAAVYPLGTPTLAMGAFTAHAIGYLLYYVGFEYHFRGFLLLGLERYLGGWVANFLQAGIVTLAHLGKPSIELAVAYPASVLFGWIVLRTRSIWYVVAIHWAAGVALDFFLLSR